MNGSITTLPDADGAGHHRVIMPLLSFPPGNDLKLYTGVPNINDTFYRNIKYVEPYLDHGFFFNWQTRYQVYRFERMCTDGHLKLIESARKCFPDSFMIWDCCDDVFNLTKDNKIAYDYYKKFLDNIRKICIEHMDRICVGTQNNKQSMIEQGVDPEKIEIVPNVLYKRFYPVKNVTHRDLREEDEIRFAWFGSTSYWKDVVEFVYPQMRALKEAIPNAKFYLPEFMNKVSPPDFDSEMFEWVLPNQLGQYLFTQDFHFGFHLMRDTRFNRARTSSKIKEMLFSGGMIPLTFLPEYDDDGNLIKVLNPLPEDTVEFVRSIINGDISFKETVEDERSQYDGMLWFEDNLDEYKKLFGVDILENGN